MYNLQMSEYIDFSELVVNKLIEDVTIDIITYGLNPNTLYYWRVKNINNMDGKESNWSNVCQFKTRALDIIYTSILLNNVIYYEPGKNRVSTWFAPIGVISDKMCWNVSISATIGGDTLGCCGKKSELL